MGCLRLRAVSLVSAGTFLVSLVLGLSEGLAVAQPAVKVKKKPLINSVAPAGSNAGSEEGGSAKEKATSDQPVGGESHMARTKHPHSAALLYTHLSDFILSYGASGAYGVSPDLQVGGLFLMGSKSKDYSETSTIKSSAKYTGSAFSLYGRYFIGNSFNMFSGLGYRQAKVTYSIQDTSGIKLDGTLSIQSVVIPLFLGNAWTWGSGFTLGVDWIGMFLAVSGSAKSELSGNLDSTILKSFNDSFVTEGDRLAKSNSLTLFLTTVGWAF